MATDRFLEQFRSLDPSLIDIEPGAKPLVIIPREEWNGPRVPDDDIDIFDENLVPPMDNIILSYTGTPTCFGLEECKKAMYHMYETSKEKAMYDIPYNFVVGGDGVVYEGRGWKRRPQPRQDLPDLDKESLEIAHFGEKGKPPAMKQMNGSWDLLLKGIELSYIRASPERHTFFY